jgi:hypothetical protein
MEHKPMILGRALGKKTKPLSFCSAPPHSPLRTRTPSCLLNHE